MKPVLLPAIFLLFFSLSVKPGITEPLTVTTTDSIPYIIGNFTDDYGLHYSISDSLWEQLPAIKYHILKWNKKEQYIIAENDAANPTEPGLYTRIDYMPFTGMQPYLWGFCYTAYKATSDKDAELTAAADRNNPRKGCNNYPFSRMKKTE